MLTAGIDDGPVQPDRFELLKKLRTLPVIRTGRPQQIDHVHGLALSLGQFGIAGIQPVRQHLGHGVVHIRNHDCRPFLKDSMEQLASHAYRVLDELYSASVPGIPRRHRCETSSRTCSRTRFSSWDSGSLA